MSHGPKLSDISATMRAMQGTPSSARLPQRESSTTLSSWWTVLSAHADSCSVESTEPSLHHRRESSPASCNATELYRALGCRRWRWHAVAHPEPPLCANSPPPAQCSPAIGGHTLNSIISAVYVPVCMCLALSCLAFYQSTHLALQPSY